MALGLGVCLAGVMLGLAERHLRALELGQGVVIHPWQAPERGWLLSEQALVTRGRTARPEDSHPEERIVVIGDSVTDGGGLDPKLTWPAQASGLIKGRGTEIVNLSVFGYDACQIVSAAREAERVWQPDRIVYASFTNDHHRSSLLYLDKERTRPTYTGASVGLEGLPTLLDPLLNLASFRLWMGARKLRSQDGPDVDWDRYEACIADLGTLETPVLVFSLLPHVMGLGTPEAVDPYMPFGYEGRVEVEARYRAAATAAGLPFASVFGMLTAQGKTFFQEGHPEDVAHPNQAGHRVFAESFLEALRRWELGQPQLVAEPVARVGGGVPHGGRRTREEVGELTPEERKSAPAERKRRRGQGP